MNQAHLALTKLAEQITIIDSTFRFINKVVIRVAHDDNAFIVFERVESRLQPVERNTSCQCDHYNFFLDVILDAETPQLNYEIIKKFCRPMLDIIPDMQYINLMKRATDDDLDIDTQDDIETIDRN